MGVCLRASLMKLPAVSLFAFERPEANTMFEIWLYFLLVYLVVLAPAFAYLRWRTHRRTLSFSRRHVTILTAAYWLLPFLPYVAVEAQTVVFRPLLLSSVQAALKEDGDNSRFKTCKVLMFSPLGASVYVVTVPEGEHYNFGMTFTLLPTASGWKLDNEGIDCIWSDGGNADGNIFPPYPTSEAYRTAQR